jgi:hypothetical protein
MEVIAQKVKGIDDPEFSCVQNAKSKSWIVRRRKFPLDQTPRLEAQSGTPTPPSHLVPTSEQPRQAPQQTDSNVAYLNQQPAANDDLRNYLKMLGDKFDHMADKYEEGHKKAKKQKPKEKKREPEPPPEDDIDPEALAELKRRYLEYLREEEEAQRAPPPPPVQQAPPPKKPIGKYTPARGRLSIFDY